MIISIIILMFLPYILKNTIIRSGAFRPAHKVFFWIFVFNCCLLGWIGGIPVMEPYLSVGRFLSFLYFFFILVLFPLAIFIDRTIYNSYSLRN
jgi:ubiquinol-cytochrome c reductase cytochrome b subunit